MNPSLTIGRLSVRATFLFRRLEIERSTRIRVLHLGNPTGLYGAERWILALVRHLPRDSVASIVSVIEDDPRFADAALCRQAAIHGFETAQFRSPGKLSVSAIGQIKRFIRKNQIDVIHTHGYKTDIIGRLATIGTRCKNISTPHGWSTEAGIKIQLYEGLDRISFYFMDAVVPLSPDLYENLTRQPGLKSRLQYIHNGVDLSEIDAVTRQEWPLPHGVADGELIIGYIGQLITRKRIDTLINAFQSLNVPDIHLWIIGDGPARLDLENDAASSGNANNIHFLGFRSDRLALLRYFDVFVLPSALEGIPRCLLEAMAAGVPAIASNIPGCTDLIEDKVTGLLFDLGDTPGLKSAIETITNNKDLRKSLGRAGQTFVRNRYSATSMAEKYLMLYSSLNRAGRSENATNKARY